MVSTAAISAIAASNASRTQREQDEAQQTSQLSNGCKYSVKIAYGEFQCMTQDEYNAYKSAQPGQISNTGFLIGLSVIISIGVFMFTLSRIND